MPALSAEELLIRASQNGFVTSAHKEEDARRNVKPVSDNVKRNRANTLRRYVAYHLNCTRECIDGNTKPDEAAARAECLQKGIEAPDVTYIKDFFRFYVATSTPRRKNKHKTTRDPQEKDKTNDQSMKTVAKWFFGGFAEATGTQIPEADRTEIQAWIKHVLPHEGIIGKEKRTKFNLFVKEITRMLVALFTKNDLTWIADRERLQFMILLLLYTITGARIDAFFKEGVRYRDFSLVLQREGDGPNDWSIICKVNQRFTKGNTDPENVVFGAANKEHPTLIFCLALFIVILAVLDGALEGIDSIEDLTKQKLWEKEEYRPLRFRDDALFKHVFRKCSKKHGVEDSKMTKARFLRIFNDTFVNAGYYDHPVIHGIRRGLGLLIDELYTDVQRSQHLTQADPKVFNTSYVANCSSVDGQAAFHGDGISDRRHIQYFQGSEQFHEDGLPTTLPASKVREITENVKKQTMLTLRERYGLTRKLKKEALEEFQFRWTRERRDAKVQGLAEPEKSEESLPHSCLLVPERARLAKWMTMTSKVSREDKWAAAKDWVTLCRRNPTEYYLPGLHPKEGSCPVSTCGLVMASIAQDRRSQHIEACVRKATAERQSYRLTDVQYCHLCFELVVGRWHLHCQHHINGLESKRCGIIKECGTLIRPAFCPFCLGDQSLPAGQRLQSYTRNFQLWDHINIHLQQISGPIDCPHPLCKVILKDHEACENHFIDEHLIQAPPHGSVRKSSSDWKISLDTPVSYLDQQTKKRKLGMTLTPSLLSGQPDPERADPMILSTGLPGGHYNGPFSDTASHYDHHQSSKRLCATSSPSITWVRDPIEDWSTADTVNDALFTEFIDLSALEVSGQKSAPVASPKMRESNSETTDRQLPMIRLLVSPKEPPTVRRTRTQDNAKQAISARNGCRKLAKGSRQQVGNAKIMLRFRTTASKQR